MGNNDAPAYGKMKVKAARFAARAWPAGYIALRVLSKKFMGDVGWMRSLKEGMPVDAGGAPLPWYTYCAIHFLSERIRGKTDVFEYGVGNSTLWWATKVRRVVACEHNREWYEHFRSLVPRNVDLQHVGLDDDDRYVKCASASAPPGGYGVVVIDGRLRNRCAQSVPESLGETGVIIWDNSDRLEYEEGLGYLQQRGFSRLDFHGLGPLSEVPWTTTILYRQSNQFGI